MDLSKAIVVIHEVAQATYISEIATIILLGLVVLPIISLSLKEKK